MKKNFIYGLLIVIVCLASCKKGNDNEIETQGTVQLGLSQQELKLKSTATNETPSTVVITIADSKGKVVVESKRVALMNMNGSYLSDPLSLITGNYSITKFIVLNSADSAIYATPVQGSKLAYLVTTPLPIAFSISKDQVTKIVPEVLSVKNAKFEDFGYDSFSFNIVTTFDFLTSIMVYNESLQNWELTSANITIKAANNTIAYTGALTAITNQITLRDNSNSFSITVSKDGYETYTASFTAEDLKLFFKSVDKGPLIIKLFSESSTLADIDGNVYHTVKIGTQVWMVENLKVTKYRNGDNISNITTDNSAWKTTTTGAYCIYNNEMANKSIYGALYNWYAATDARSIAPAGWHLPSATEWTTLINYLGGSEVAGGKLKESGLEHWLSPNTDANNSSMFTALPGGYRDSYGYFHNLSYNGIFWLSTETDTIGAYAGQLYYERSACYEANNFKLDGFSVRCLKD